MASGGRAQLCRSLILFSLITLLSTKLFSACIASPQFEGFGDEEEPIEETEELDETINFRSTSHPPITHSSDFQPPESAETADPTQEGEQQQPPPPPSSVASTFEYWDEDEFEGIPMHNQPTKEEEPQPEETLKNQTADDSPVAPSSTRRSSYHVEMICVSFLIAFAVNYFTGKRENENTALAWAAHFATKDSIFEKNFSLLGTGDGKDTPLLLKEGQNVFKFYASGRRFCQSLLATMELQSRHDLISRLYNLVVPCKDQITFEVFMNDDSMDHVVFALAKKKVAKVMHKESKDLQRFATLLSPPTNRKWVPDDLTVISESREVASDLINDAVLDQVFGEKAFEKFGKSFISLHFSDQYPGSQRKVLIFKFTLPPANKMSDMTRLVLLVPYYIDLIGRYKLGSQARAKAETARAKLAQELYKELQIARQEALQKKKAERRKLVEEAESKLTAEAIRKKEEKERARQMKKAMPKVKMTRVH
ncbi:Uncharacterized protein EJ110_NYTH52577 [Nymphaea thermarum]|nr:Uncharacterized protein EJ110_NYTH52577 [Nymphaea thermarum]